MCTVLACCAYRRLADWLLVCVILCSSVAVWSKPIDFDQSIGLKKYPVQILYAQKNERIAQRIAEICEESIPAMALELGLDDVGPFQIQVIPDFKPYRLSTRNDLPRWGVAFAFMESQLVLVDAKRAANRWNSLEKTIPHELSHILLAQRVGPIAFPLWFVEGLAQWQAGQWSLVESWWLMDAVWTGRAPALGQIARGYPRDESPAKDAYRISYAAFTFLFKNPKEELPMFLDQVRASGSFDEAFAVFCKEDIYSFYLRFHTSIQKRYSSRLLIFQSGPLFSVAAVVFIIVFIRIKIRNRRKLKQMERSEMGLP
jgi:hypothetical protein